MENKDITQFINLNSTMRALYTRSEIFIWYSYLAQGLLFIMAIFLAFYNSKENIVYIVVCLIASIIFLLLNEVFLYFSKIYYDIGEDVRKFEMLEKIFSSAVSSVDKSYLIAKIPSKMLIKTEEKSDNSTVGKDKYEQIIDKIQENCFYTSELMKIHSRTLMIGIIVISLFYFLAVMFFIFHFSRSNPNVQSGVNAFACMTAAVNFIIAIKVFSHYRSFSQKSDFLNKIDKKLGEIKNNPTEDDVITTFSEYNCVLSDALPCPNYTFKRNGKDLKFAWKNRVKNG